MRFAGEVIPVEDGDTVLDALVRAGAPVKKGCGVGSCQACLVRSQAPTPRAQVGLDARAIEIGGFLACRAPAAAQDDVDLVDDLLYPRIHAQLVTKTLLAPNILGLRFAAPGLSVEPGRFIRLCSGDIDRAYSIANHATDGEGLDLHVKLLPGGAMSGRLLAAEIGESFDVRGPMGKCTFRESMLEKPLLFIGSGTGLAPLYSVLTAAIEAGHSRRRRLYIGATKSNDFYFQDVLANLDVEVTRCVDIDPDPGMRLGNPVDHALIDQPDLTGTVVFLCGHPNLVRQGQKRCFLAGANLADIHADSFEPSG